MHHPTPDAERQISLVGLHSINLVVVVLTLTRIIKSVVTGQAPVTMELRNIPEKKHKQTKRGTCMYTCKVEGGGHIVSPAGLPIEQVLPGEYSLS